MAAAAVAVQQVTTVATVMSETRNAGLGGEQPLLSPPKQQLTTPPKPKPLMVCQCVSVALVARDKQFHCDDSHCSVQEYEDRIEEPQYAVFPPTARPYSTD